MTAPNESSGLTWRMFFTGRGAGDLPAAKRLVLDLLGLATGLVVLVVFVVLTDNTAFGLIYVVVFGTASALIAFYRYWRRR